jgi:hypothetical protein
MELHTAFSASRIKIPSRVSVMGSIVKSHSTPDQYHSLDRRRASCRYDIELGEASSLRASGLESQGGRENTLTRMSKQSRRSH